MNFRPRLAVTALSAFVAWTVLASPPAKLDPVQPQQYLEHVKALAAPEMEGRGADTEGIHDAADYIAERFEEFGLQPAGEMDDYLQSFVVTTGAQMGEDNGLTARLNGQVQDLDPEKDYLPLNFSDSGIVTGGLVFAGFGISAEEFDYDDYFHLPVEGKIVVVLRYEPDKFSHKGEGKDKLYTHHSHLISKAINARNRGAKAVILVNGNVDAGEGDKLVKFGSVSGPENAGILVAHVKNSVAQKWFAAAGKSLIELQQTIERESRPQSFLFPDSLQLTLEVDIEREQATVGNVVGYLPGESDEYLIIGAHYDHLGRGGENSLAPSKIGQIHAGADDNASGTAGLIELARAFSSVPGQRKRGILFMAFAGEEIGLLGSSHWVSHPTLPLEKAVAMINMDMIGRVKNSKLFIGGVGTGSTFQPLVERVAGNYDFQTDYSQEGYSSSDHTSFVAKKIPVLFFFSGLHADYHKPSDTWEKINADAAAKVLGMIFEIGQDLVAANEPPQFVKVERSERGSRGDGAGGGYGPYFGSVPDFGQVEKGVKFADVRGGSPADKAGLKAGDVLLQFGDKPINNLYDFTYALRDSKVGDVVEVKVVRDGQTITTKVTLEERK
jgi:hypothetical protein